MNSVVNGCTFSRGRVQVGSGDDEMLPPLRPSFYYWVGGLVRTQPVFWTGRPNGENY